MGLAILTDSSFSISDKCYVTRIAFILNEKRVDVTLKEPIDEITLSNALKEIAEELVK